MASCTQTTKAVSDIQDCIHELGKSFSIAKLPINDDNVTLHRLEEKLEFILQLGLKEKPSVFGVKKSYWDYVSACHNSSKRFHLGIKFVKTNLELKTSVGRGRAFIRFCLMQKSLDDTLQTCFIDQKTTRDFYAERSLPLQPKLWSPFVTSLYELNEINFDLNPQYSELDASWPSFARKIFHSSENEGVNERNFTSHLCTSLIDNCNSDVFDDDDDKDENSFSADKSLKETQHLAVANSVLEANVLYLQKKCESLEKEICSNVQREHTDSFEKDIKGDEDLKISQESVRNEKFKGMNNNYYFGDNSLNKDDSFVKHINTELNLKLENCPVRVCDSRIGGPMQIYSETVDSNVTCLPTMHSDCSGMTENGHMSTSSDTPKLLNIFNASPSSLSSDLPSNLISGLDTDVSSVNVDMNGKNGVDFDNCVCTNLLSSIQTLPLHNDVSDSLNVLFFRTKNIIDNLRNGIENSPEKSQFATNLKDLKSTWDCFETSLFAELKKLKDFHSQKKFWEEYTFHMKSLANKQEILIDTLVNKMNSSVKENETLYSKISFLKDKLHSYGLLKIQAENNISPPQSVSPPVDKALALPNCTVVDNVSFQSCDQATDDCLQSLDILKTSFSKLHALNAQAAALQSWVESSQKLNSNLISRVQDQEMHMKGITRELEEAHHLLSVMRKQHKKLQSAENIVKYDLQEKRKLLTRLKHQLETTREDCNLVRIKNSKSEVEWQNLRKEFVQRHKQTSEESGFVDDKVLEEQNSSPLNSLCENSMTDNDAFDEVNLDDSSIEIKSEVKKSRLELLEEQCQILCANLLNSSKKRQEIDSHLESLCKIIDKPNAEKEIPVEKLTETCNLDDDKIYLDEVTGENVDCNSEANSSITSEIESFNSDSCSNDPLNSTTISRNVSSSVDSLKADNVIPSDDIDLLCCQNNLLSENILLDKDSVPITTQIFNINSSLSTKSMKDTSDSCSEEFLEEITDFHSKDSDVEKTLSTISENCSIGSPKQVEFHEMHLAEKDSLDMDCDSISKTISDLQEDNQNLQSKLQELEQQNISFSSQMNQKAAIEAAKEHEITALQFQLNSQTLQYEKALKEFSDTNDGLKNMKQKVSDQEQLILTLEEALTEIQMERENEKELQWEQLEDFKRYNLKDREAMETEILHLQNYSKELQKKVIKLLKQKDILWKQNDHLTFVQKIQIDDRWMADHEVTECLGCRSNFSFILRKHHCRHCGRIFCYSCSNNWLLTPSSRKQIRVCNECYMQHMEMKKVVRRDSNPPYFDDESEDEASTDDVSSNMNQNSSLHSESLPNRTNSIVSLPIMQINRLQRKGHFTSAPDLHLTVENSGDLENFSASSQPVLTCDTEDSEKGINKDLIIRSREEAILPILCETDSSELHWSVYPREAIPITLMYEDATHTDGQTVLHQSACEVESVIHLSLPGLYNFHFDNRSRSTSIVVHYSLKMLAAKEQGMYR